MDSAWFILEGECIEDNETNCNSRNWFLLSFLVCSSPFLWPANGKLCSHLEDSTAFLKQIGHWFTWRRTEERTFIAWVSLPRCLRSANNSSCHRCNVQEETPVDTVEGRGAGRADLQRGWYWPKVSRLFVLELSVSCLLLCTIGRMWHFFSERSISFYEASSTPRSAITPWLGDGVGLGVPSLKKWVGKNRRLSVERELIGSWFASSECGSFVRGWNCSRLEMSNKSVFHRFDRNARVYGCWNSIENVQCSDVEAIQATH